MNPTEAKICLTKTLKSLINNDYILLDLPYYTNVGDVLIWQSCLDLLKNIKHKCLYSSSIETYRKPKINESVIILFMGGGNFGDIWERHQLFRQIVLKDFPRNPIIQLPQSVCYKSNIKLQNDIKIFSSHQAPITICLRDQKSYDIIKENYMTVTPLLLPDLVLSFDVSSFIKKNKIQLQNSNGSIYIKRKDVELNEDIINKSILPQNIDEADWPPIMEKPKYIKIINTCKKTMKKMRVPWYFQRLIIDLYYKYLVKDKIISSGIKFINKYDVVYSTRLHAAILAYLLEKQVFVFDNTYGKCSGCCKLWLKDQPNITVL